jgi:hypothetical protein
MLPEIQIRVIEKSIKVFSSSSYSPRRQKIENRNQETGTSASLDTARWGRSVTAKGIGVWD